MELVIAEKPSVARDLARVLGVRGKGEHAFEGEHHVVTWCIGHLVELDEPASYDPAWKAWRLDRLPMLPEEFRLRAAAHARGQLGAVGKLLRDKRFAAVINACDAGREGELIFRYVYQHARSRLPIRRLWVSSLTDDAIRKGFAKLAPGAAYNALADAARSRSEADWLVGMNATRALTARGRDAGHDALYSIGRVQTPTLAMLVERERAIASFVPRDYWEVTLVADGFTARWRSGPAERLASAPLADEVVARDTASEAPIVERVTSKLTREPPPQLFDLTTLQRTANRRYGWSAQRTLELAQALYERHKVVTYPRTDSRHLSSDVAAELGGPLAALAQLPEYARFAAPLAAAPPRLGRRFVDDSKVRDHHAIIPTATAPRSLDRDEARLYDLIARRFLGAFFPDAEIALTEAWLRVGPAVGAPPSGAADRQQILDLLPAMPDRYLARGRVRVVAGWQEVAGFGEDTRRDRGADDTRRDRGGEDTRHERGDDGEEREPIGALPPLVEGQRVPATFKSTAKQTTPPPHYTEATLLAAMEGAGKALDDEQLRAAMKDTGLGTPATRAAIIETLLRRAFIVRDRRALVATPTGIGLIATVESLAVSSLASPELTGTWEARLAKIARGEDQRAAFMADIRAYVAKIVDAIRGAAPPPPPAPGTSAPRQARGGRGGKQRRWRPRETNAPPPRRDTNAAPRDARDTHSPPPRRDMNAPPGDARDTHAAPPRRDTNAAPRDARDTHSPPPRRDTNAAPPRRDTNAAPRDARDTNAAPPRPRANRSASAADTRTNHALPSSGGANSTRAKRAGTNASLPSQLTCPRCNTGTLITGSRGWGCSRWREGCGFVVWFVTAGKQLTAAQLRDLVVKGKTRKADWAPGAGRLVLDRTAPGGARFEAG